MKRRDFLKTASAATLGALAAGYPKTVWGAEQAEEKLKATADTVIVLWMGGGMAHTETFDPKRYTPFVKGMKPGEMLAPSARSTRRWITSKSPKDSNTSRL